MDHNQTIGQKDASSVREMLSEAGYSDEAIEYYIEKPHFGALVDASHISEMTGTCGDTMKIFLKVDQGIITDAKYQALGCPGAVTAAMAVGELIKGKSLEYARTINDGHIFKMLKEIPAKKHHCIQLAVKTLNKALDEYHSGKEIVSNMEGNCTRCAPEDCCKEDLR